MEQGGNYIREEERGLLISTNLEMERTFCFKLMLWLIKLINEAEIDFKFVSDVM